MASLGTIGGCLRAIAEATADDIMLSKFLHGTDLTVGHVRNPRGWEDARPPRPVLVQMASQVLEFCRLQRNGSHGPQEAHEQATKAEEDLHCRRKHLIAAPELMQAGRIKHEMLIEKILPARGITVVYGASNSGKTFLMLDLGCAVATGVDWLGRYRVQQGAVLYLAAEGPQSVQFRAAAYQHHTCRRVDLLYIDPEPINFYANDLDALAVVQSIDDVERWTGEPVRLVIGDTLAAMTPGANENHGNDMGVVLANIERIVAARPVQMVLIHHSGKDEARGMRGWSGLNARTDTVIEVLDSSSDETSHSAEIVKQRDIAGRREKIGFELSSVDIGERDNFANLITSCVVMSTDKPPSERRRTSSGGSSGGNGQQPTGRPRFAEGLITGFIGAQPKGVSRNDLVKHFQGKPSRTTIYRVIDDLLATEKIVESAGMIRLNGSAS